MSAVLAKPQVKDLLKTLAKGKEKGQEQRKEHDVNAHAVTAEGEPSKKPWEEDIPELSSPSYSPPTSFSYSSDSSSSSNPRRRTLFFIRLPWKVIGVMLVGALKSFKNLERRLLNEFKEIWHSDTDFEITQKGLETCLEWVNRPRPRKFGNVLEGDIQTCQKVARETGILLDPIYTLAAWEVASNLAFSGNEETAMLHTGGTMSLFGVAQRYPTQF
ncbi:hypothetical protein L7F22_028342 [Adiantum nelumboides]|nr:hypothetical protein [Adiantum nelumboides]